MTQPARPPVPGETGKYAVPIFDITTVQGWLDEWDRHTFYLQGKYGWCYVDYCYSPHGGLNRYGRKGVEIPLPDMRQDLPIISNVPMEWLSEEGKAQYAGKAQALIDRWSADADIVCAYAVEHRNVRIEDVNNARKALNLRPFELHTTIMSQFTSRIYFQTDRTLTLAQRATIENAILEVTTAKLREILPKAKVEDTGDYQKTFRAETVREQVIGRPVPEPEPAPAVAEAEVPARPNAEDEVAAVKEPALAQAG